MWCLLLVTTSVLISGCHDNNPSYETTLTVRLYSRQDANAKHAIALIKIAAEKANVGLVLEIEPKELSAQALREALSTQAVDVIWTATSVALEDRFRAIRVPLYRGLLGYRICLVHNDDRERLRSVDSVEAFKALQLGQGEGWSDVDVLREAGFAVTEMPYEALFEAVDQRTVDCVPRAIFEAYPEQYEQRYRYFYKLYVERHVMLYYRLPFYFFIHPDNAPLQHMLERGLRQAVADGSYETLIKKNPSLLMAMRKIRQQQRRVFTIPNHTLPTNTPLNDGRLWFNPE